jgi:nicotinamidase-related amidase
VPVVLIVVRSLTAASLVQGICGVGDDARVAGLLQREDSVLVVVDAQPGFLAKETFTDSDTAAARVALARMAWLVAIAARLELPVVVTEEEPERHGATAAAIAAVLPDGAQVFRKPTFGLANTPEILEAVRETGRRTAVLIGCETDVCVAQSAIGLLERRFSCVVVEDATFSPGEMHARGLERLASAGVARNHAKGVTYEWLRSVDDAHAVLRAPDLQQPPFSL